MVDCERHIVPHVVDLNDHSQTWEALGRFGYQWDVNENCSKLQPGARSQLCKERSFFEVRLVVCFKLCSFAY